MLSYYGEGEKSIGLFSHADAVNVSDDWLFTEPFNMIEKDCFLIGRGVSDDKAAKVNVDDEPELAMKFKVSSIPMLVFFKDGKIISTSVGYRPKDEILNELKLYMNQG